MLSTSADFMSAIKNDVREMHARITINDRVFGNSDLLTVSYDSGSLAGETFAIGSTFSNSIKISFSNLVEGLNELDEVKVEIGIRLPDESIEFIPLGIFVINEKIQMDRNNNKTSIECMDRMVMLGGIYESKLAYPAEIREVALEIANLSGVEVNDNFDRLMPDKIFKPEGYTFRQAIGLIAQFHAGFATFDRFGKLEIKTLVETEYKILPSNYMSKGLTKNEMMFRLGGISVKTGDEETAVLTIGSSSGSQINLENKVMTKELLSKVYEKIRNINYFPFTLKWRGDPSLESGDWVAITDLEGNLFKTPNLAYSISFNGGMNATSTADTQTQSDATYEYRGQLQQQIDFLNNRIGAAGNQIYEGLDEPVNPRENDMWFKPNGPDMEIWIYSVDSITGELGWVFKVSTAVNQELLDAMVQMEEELQVEQERIDNVIEQADLDRANADFTAGRVGSIEALSNTAIQQSQEALIEATKAFDKFNNLAIADGNLLLNSSLALDSSSWKTWSVNTEGKTRERIRLDGLENIEYGFRISSTIPSGYFGHLQSGIAVLPNSDYIASFWYLPEIGTSVTIQIGPKIDGTYFRANTPIATEKKWMRHSVALKTTTEETVSYVIGFQNSQIGSADFAGFMLARGTTLGNWTSNPQDAQIEIARIDGQLVQKVNQTTFDALKGTVETQGTLISQNQSELKLKAEKSVVDVINQTVQSQGTQIALNSQAIELRAEKTYVDAINQTVQTQIASIELTVNGIQQTVSTKASQTQVTQLANQITSVVQTVDGHTSQITQLATDINLKVSKNDVITQINLSAESDTILIQASRIHLSGTSKIDNAVIKSAMIESVTANQITAGTLNAALINVINLNANSITTGTLTGSNMELNLNTGTYWSKFAGIGSSELTLVGGVITTKGSQGDEGVLRGGSLVFSYYEGEIVAKGLTFTPWAVTFTGKGIGTRILEMSDQGLQIKPGAGNAGLALNTGLELMGAQTYIDFHVDNRATDYDARMIASRMDGTRAVLETISTEFNIKVGRHGGIYNADGAGFKPFYAASFNTSSETIYKEKIEKFRDTAIETLKILDFKVYDRTDSNEKQAGLLLEDAPALIVNGAGIDLYSYTTLVAKALQELLIKLDL